MNLDVLTLPPRLVVRALDDLHTLAVSSQRLADSVAQLPKIEQRLRGRLEQLDRALGGMVQLGEDMRRTIEHLETLERAVVKLTTSTVGLISAIEPIGGITRRVGRIADRLPRGRQGSSPIPGPAGGDAAEGRTTDS